MHKSRVSFVVLFVRPKITCKESNGPEDEVHPLSRYSSSVGIWPLWYHVASTSNALQKLTHWIIETFNIRSNIHEKRDHVKHVEQAQVIRQKKTKKWVQESFDFTIVEEKIGYFGNWSYVLFVSKPE